MAYDFGSLSCLEGVLEDIQDLQLIISEYVSHLGPLNCPSWKYPDQLAADVNIDQLITRYTGYLTSDSSQENDARQVAHLALYELVIDRMVYLLHASAKFIIPLITSMKRPNSSLPLEDSANLAGSNSVGLVVKQGWHLQKILQTCITQLFAELKNKKQLIFELEEKERNSQKSDSCSTSLSSSPTAKNKSPQPNSVSLSPDGSIKSFISRDQCFKSCQTVETSFLPCEACSVVQESFHQTGKVVSQLSQELNLPSRLSRYTSTFDNTKWMTANEVMQWSSEQNKDLSVIGRYVENTLQPLKESVESLEKKCSSLESQKRVLEKKNILERETQETIRKQLNNKLQDTIKIHETEMNEINKEKTNLGSQLKNLREKFELIQDECEKVKNMNKKNEMEIQQLREKLKTQTNIACEVEELQKQIQTLKIQTENSEKKFFECNKELNQEQAKNKSMAKHFESIQVKQCSTLEHVEKLNDENTDLQNQLAELQDFVDEKQEQIENLERQQKQTQQKIIDNEVKIKLISQQNEEMENLMKEMKTQNDFLNKELKRLEESENLLIQYPDLNGPVLDESLCSGNVMYDMELQIQANIVRIELLEKQNQTLRLSLKKMNEKYESHDQAEKELKEEKRRDKDKVNPQPVSLWKMKKSKSKDHNKRELGEPVKDFNQKFNLLLSKSIEKNSDSSETLNHCVKDGRVSSAVSLQKDSCSATMKNNSDLFRSKSSNGIRNKRPSKNDTEQIICRVSKPSSVKTYISLKQQGKLHNDNAWSQRRKSQSSETEPSGRTSSFRLQTQTLTFVCKRCDKMYLEAKELKIHSLYCKE